MYTYIQGGEEGRGWGRGNGCRKIVDEVDCSLLQGENKNNN